jgi:hypothetical protein
LELSSFFARVFLVEAFTDCLAVIFGLEGSDPSSFGVITEEFVFDCDIVLQALFLTGGGADDYFSRYWGDDTEDKSAKRQVKKCYFSCSFFAEFWLSFNRQVDKEGYG